MNYSFVAQIALLVIAIAMFVTYTQPTFAEIRQLQDELFQYTDVTTKASDFNQKLRELISREASFRSSDLAAMDTYLPTSLDTVAVMADIAAIARRSGVTLGSLSAGDDTAGNSQVVVEGTDATANLTSSHDFSVTVDGNYENLKQFLDNLEKNKYPLEVVDFQIGSVATAASSAKTPAKPTADNAFELTLRTYTLDVGVLNSDSASTKTGG